MISYAYWTRRFGRRPDAVGSTLFVKGVPFTIVGITGPAFVGLGRGRSTDVWIPIQTRAELKPWGRSPDSRDTFHNSPNWWFLLTIGRLAPGVTMDQALAIAQPAFARAAYAPGGGAPRKGETAAQLSFSSARGMMGLREQYRQPLSVLMAMVALVLLIACGNVAMLLAARNSARLREFSLRSALGGSTSRLLRQLLAESALLVAAGTVLGWFIALWATRALAALSELEVTLAPDRDRLRVRARSLDCSRRSLFGLAPLRTARRVPLGLVLKSSSLNATADRGRMRGSRIVLAGQIALCVALLVGAGLLVRTLQNLDGADLGMRTSGLFVFGVTAAIIGQERHGRRPVLSVAARARALAARRGIGHADGQSHRLGLEPTTRAPSSTARRRADRSGACAGTTSARTISACSARPCYWVATSPKPICWERRR